MLAHHHSKGFTLIELLVSLLVGTIAIAVVLTLLKTAYGLAGQIKLQLDDKLYVREFVKTFHEDVSSAGYVDLTKPPNAGDASLSADCKSLCLDSKNPLRLRLRSDLIDVANERVSHLIEYEVKKIDPVRSIRHPNEMGIYKYTTIRGVYQYGQSDGNRLVLAGVESFYCDPINFLGVASTKTLKCRLAVFRSMNKDDLDIFEVYATNEN
jgi:prepilin-type N-terminal cleavage/methylation domain-containing protein